MAKRKRVFQGLEDLCPTMLKQLVFSQFSTFPAKEVMREKGGGGDLQFPPEFTSPTISKEVYNGLISTFTYWAKSITVDALKVSTSIIGMLL